MIKKYGYASKVMDIRMFLLRKIIMIIKYIAT